VARMRASEKVGAVIIYSILFVLMLVTLYPFWHVLMYSLSEPLQAMEGGLFLLPRGLSLISYRMVVSSSGIFTAYGNSILRTVAGTTLNILLTASLAYPLSLRRLRGRRVISMLIFFTMLFSGGMIPMYLLVRSLGLLNNRLALILPGAISAFNMFVLRNYFQSLPPSLEESANMDGATPLRILFAIVLPISMPAIAAVTLFYAVDHWNAFFDAVLYINSTGKQVLQVFLRVMYQSSALNTVAGSTSYDFIGEITEDSLRMAIVSLAILPMLAVYPFLQKYYVKGVLIGSIKG
jgi:putative aldouronate transport system permease protein